MECALYYDQFCEDKCTDDQDCECMNHEYTVIIDIYDSDKDGSICPEEFESLFLDVTNGEIPWPDEQDEEDEQDENDEKDDEEKDEDEENDDPPHI